MVYFLYDTLFYSSLPQNSHEHTFLSLATRIDILIVFSSGRSDPRIVEPLCCDKEFKVDFLRPQVLDPVTPVLLSTTAQARLQAIKMHSPFRIVAEARESP